jgi:hypothetical protein
VKIAPIVLNLNACAIQYALVLLYNPDPNRALEINCPQPQGSVEMNVQTSG